MRDLRLHLPIYRLDQYLEYVVTYTDDTAYIQAARADHLFSEVSRNTPMDLRAILHAKSCISITPYHCRIFPFMLFLSLLSCCRVLIWALYRAFRTV